MREEIRVNRSKKSKIIKLIAVGIFVIISLVVCFKLFPLIKNLGSEQARIEFKDYLEGSGTSGAFYIIGLQFSQTIVAILPGEPIEILAGMYYGPIGGTIFMLMTFLIFSTLIFFLVKKIGINLVYTFCNEQQVIKIQNSAIFQNPKKVERLLCLLYILPGTPKDLLTYIAGVLPIKNPIIFLLMSTVARIPSIISSTIIGTGILKGSIYKESILYILIYVLVIISIIIYMKTAKDIDAKNALKTMK